MDEAAVRFGVERRAGRQHVLAGLQGLDIFASFGLKETGYRHHISRGQFDIPADAVDPDQTFVVHRERQLLNVLHGNHVLCQFEVALMFFHAHAKRLQPLGLVVSWLFFLRGGGGGILFRHCHLDLAQVEELEQIHLALRWRPLAFLVFRHFSPPV